MGMQGLSPNAARLIGVIAGLAAASAFYAWVHEDDAPDLPDPPAPISTPAAASPGRSKVQAMAALMALPELKAWSSRLETTSGGKLHGALIEYDPAPKIVNGKSYWQLSFVENGADAAHSWESFLVAQDAAADGSDILVEDFATDKLLTLAQWRRDKHPMDRTSAEATGG